jgi:N-acyl-D-amino-acid deacylase
MIPLWLIAASLVSAPSTETPVRAAIGKGLSRLEIAATNYVKNRNCFSCHNQAVPLMAMVAARERGFAVDDEFLAVQTRYTVETFSGKLKSIREGSGIGGANTTAAYALVTLKAVGHDRDKTTDALIEFLLKNQHKDGYWKPTTVRPPSEGSPFTSTALALRALKHYGQIEQGRGDSRLREAKEKAAAYLLRSKVDSTEDRVFRLIGLAAAEVNPDAIALATEELIQRQRPDGGWAQLDNMTSDAYATGSVMVALRAARLPSNDVSYQRGVQFLLKSQDQSGVWLVQSRSKPIQKLFDNGDPGGNSQFITIAATGWAVWALAETLEKR